MNTKYLPTRTMLYFELIALLLSSCAPSALQATRQHVQAQVDAAIASSTDVLYAIGPVVPGCKDMAYMVFNESQQIAFFVTKGATAAGGGNYTYISAVDASHGVLLNAGKVLQQMGIRLSEVRTFADLKSILRARGFTELTAASLPFLAQAVRLGLSYLRQAGASVSDFILIPAGMLTPEQMYDWMQCDGGECSGQVQ